MKLKSQNKINKVISIVLLLAWCSLIFYFSNQNGDLSTNSSSFILKIINGFLQIFNHNMDITNSSVMSFIIRKLAHMFLYFILYLFTYYAMYQFKISKRSSLAFIFSFVYATTDEFHQLFIANRSGQILDVFIDTFGSFLAYSSLKIIKKRKKVN